MSMSGCIVRSVLEKAVKYSITPDDVAGLVNNIFNNLEWDNDCPYTSEDVINEVDHEIKNKYSSVNKQAYIDYLNKFNII